MSCRMQRWTALFTLLLVLTGRPTAFAHADTATKLYVGQYARLSAIIPASWTADRNATFDYVGPDGFVTSIPLSGDDLNGACASLSTSIPLDDASTPRSSTWQGASACRIDGSMSGQDVSILVIPHPYPFDLFESHYSYAALLADPRHFGDIVDSLSFSPDRVTPEAFISGVLDLVEARSYWASEIDWPEFRKETLASVEGLPSLELVQGVLLAIQSKLQAAGDNHSWLLLAGQANYIAGTNGFGMLVGGTQILMVYAGGPADRAGLQAGDVIETVNGSPFFPLPSPMDPAMLGGFDPSRSWGDLATIVVRRSGGNDPINVTVAQGPYEYYAPPSGHRLTGDIGYLTIPLFRSGGKGTEFSATANELISTIDQSPTCGWVIDLRLNMGGSYSPMITAVGPILGNGRFVGWRTRDGFQTWIAYDHGRITDNGNEVSNYLAGNLYTLQQSDPPVAVLIGPLTGSSGEVTTLAFMGRPDSRFFGERSAGATTAIGDSALFDGSVFGIANAAMTDRFGQTYLSGIEPDEPVAINWTTFGTDADPVLKAATAWLAQQPTCAGGD